MGWGKAIYPTCPRGPMEGHLTSNEAFYAGSSPAGDTKMKKELTSEQQVVVDRWKRESEARNQLFDVIEAAMDSKDEDLFHKTLEEFLDISPVYCEHGHTIYDGCLACEEIERILGFGEYDDEDE